MLHRTALIFTGLALASACTPASTEMTSTAPPVFVCDSDMPEASYTQSEQALIDTLWDETLVYLEGFSESLRAGDSQCDTGAGVILQTVTADGEGPETGCIDKYKDVDAVLSHIRAVLDHPDEAKACFDPQKNYDAFALYSPGKAALEESEVASWIERPAMAEYYAGTNGPIGESGRELSEGFWQILKDTTPEGAFPVDVTANGLPNLWASVGWLPFYAENPSALNERFRGGYAYAEVMGPWGLLRIKSIDGEPVGAEVGMTIQLANTFYPYHYHHPQEIYITLTEPQCVRQNSFMVGHWDNPAFTQARRDDGWDVDILPTENVLQEWFASQAPSGNAKTYFERNAIHAFNLEDACPAGSGPRGLVTVWARTTARDNNQTTRICQPQASLEDGKALPGMPYTCALDDFE
ncbi:MAG: hypothetical protein GYB49_01930 [Alphaproteobacteria bacterium]|nr:hypothetical protein [Alphaproteobacteria bacterium]|tara:strand:+ start:5562 stop:6788 length:1227 start_codon:yes stop_codon:yes gene_type:complete